MAERYTKADVARILASINEAAADLRLDGAGHWTVETMGGRFLYLTDRSPKPGVILRPSSPGERIEELGLSWHSAYLRLHTLRRDLLTVQVRQRRTVRPVSIEQYAAENRERVARQLGED